MNRVRAAFEERLSAGGRLFLPYLCAGDPDLETTRKLVNCVDENGADILELGLPFSDPVADGPTIQGAVRRSLEQGLRVEQVFTLVEQLRDEVSTPIVLMTYYNPIFKWGEQRFIKRAVEAGVDGVLVVDLPPEEGLEFYESAAQAGLATALLATPNTEPERVREMSCLATGFIYYVMVTGVTGAREAYDQQLKSRLREVSEVSQLPVVAGFGISGYEMIEPYLEAVQGVVVGSAIIERIEAHLDQPEQIQRAVGGFVSKLTQPLHKYEA